MLLKCVYFNSAHEYVAKLENGAYIIGFADGTAVDTEGTRYRHVIQFDSDDNIISDGWKIID